jgi:hypothetical protein
MYCMSTTYTVQSQFLALDYAFLSRNQIVYHIYDPTVIRFPEFRGGWRHRGGSFRLLILRRVIARVAKK